MRKPHPDADLTHLQKCTCSKDAASRIAGIADALNAPLCEDWGLEGSLTK